MLKYKISLCNVFWKMNGTETKSFKTKTEQKTYFDNLTGGEWSPLVNFNMGDNVRTNIYYKDTTTRTPTQLCKCNYAIVGEFEDDIELSRRYYFAKVYQDSGRQMYAELELDDIQTNFIGNTNIQAIINRTHLNRWVNNNDNTISFNFEDNSHLFEEETIKHSKRLISRDKLKFKYHANENINNWLNDNIAYWVYHFVDPSINYKAYAMQQSGTPVNVDKRYFKLIYSITDDNINTIDKSDLGVIFYPIYKTDKRIYITDLNEEMSFQLDETAIDNFRELNNDSTYIYSSKISFNLCIDFSTADCSIDNFGNLRIRGNTSINDNQFELSPTSGVKVLHYGSALLCGAINYPTPIESTQTLINKTLTFNVNEIKNSLRDKHFNPKLLNSNFLSITLKSSDGTSFEYDLSKINTNTPQFLYNEPLVADVTKYYCRLKASGLYIDESENNYTGLVGSVDNSIAVTNDQYANFIANNKNYWLQSTGEITSNLLTTLAGVVGGLMVGGPVGAIVGGVGGLVGVAGKQINKHLTADNMKQAPNQLKNAMGNVYFNSNVDELGIYLEVYESLEHEEQAFDDYIYLNGFSYEEKGNIFDFIFTRKYFNYIECDIIESTLPLISNDEKQRLLQKFSSGVRFIHNENEYIQNLNMENYETYLDNIGV